MVKGKEGLLDATGRDEAVEEGGGTGLVVGTTAASTTERLLADDGTSALVVDVEVTGGGTELVGGEDDGGTVLGEDGTGKGVASGGVDEVASGLELIVGEDVSSDDGAKDLLGHGTVMGILGEEDGGVDEVTDAIVVGTTGDDLDALGGLGVIDVATDLVEGGLVDDGGSEVLKVTDITHGQGLDLTLETCTDAGPEALGAVETGEGRALLTLEFKGGTDGLVDDDVGVGGGMNEMEVLTTGLTDDTGVATVGVDALANLPPELTEDVGGAGEVKGGKVTVGEDLTGNLLGITGNELDDAGGKTGFLEDLVDEVVGVGGGGRGLPDDDVTHEGGGGSEVTADGGEVEGGDGVNEALEGTEFGAVPDAIGVLEGLDLVDVLGVIAVEAEEISEFSGGVNLGLPGVLALTKHGGGHELVPVLGGDEVSGLEEDGGTVVEGHGLPCVTGGEGALDGLLGEGGIGGLVLAEELLVLARHGLALELLSLGGMELLAVDHDGDLEGGGAVHTVDGSAKLLSLLASRSIVVHGLIADSGELKGGKLRGLHCDRM